MEASNQFPRCGLRGRKELAVRLEGLKQTLQGRAEQIEDHNIVVSLDAEPAHLPASRREHGPHDA